MEIIRLDGTDKRLYELVAPMVMNPAIIRQNNGYPFKTSKDYVWYIAIDGNGIEGFMPLKKSNGRILIDNYYVRGDKEPTIHGLLEKIIADKEEKVSLKATAFKRHVDIFKKHGFLSAIELRKYDKMIYNGTKGGKDDEAA